MKRKSMGKGNRTEREKLPPEQKSQVMAFRLDPKKDMWALHRVDWYQSEYNWGLRELFIKGLEALEGVELSAEPVSIHPSIVHEMWQMLQSLSEHAANGGSFGVYAENRETGEITKRQLKFSNGTLDTFDRYAGGGVSIDDED